MNIVISHGIWEYPVRVAGTTLYIKSTDALLSDEVEIERDCGNPVDPNAIAVYSVRGTKRIHVGHLPKEISRGIFDRQLPAKGRVVWKTDATQLPGIRISI